MIYKIFNKNIEILLELWLQGIKIIILQLKKIIINKNNK